MKEYLGETGLTGLTQLIKNFIKENYLSLKGGKIDGKLEVPDPKEELDATNKKYVDKTVAEAGGGAAFVPYSRIDGYGTELTIMNVSQMQNPSAPDLSWFKTSDGSIITFKMPANLSSGNTYRIGIDKLAPLKYNNSTSIPDGLIEKDDFVTITYQQEAFNVTCIQKASGGSGGSGIYISPEKPANIKPGELWLKEVE